MTDLTSTNPADHVDANPDDIMDPPYIPLSQAGGVTLRVVEAGTVITDDSGNSVTVTDETAVFKGRDAYVTQPALDAIKASPQVQTL